MLKGLLRLIVTFVLTIVLCGLIVFAVIYCIKEGVIPNDYKDVTWVILAIVAAIGLIGSFFEVILGNISYGLGLVIGILISTFISYIIITDDPSLGFPQREITKTVEKISRDSKDTVINIIK
jgi:hypothetical protein